MRFLVLLLLEVAVATAYAGAPTKGGAGGGGLRSSIDDVPGGHFSGGADDSSADGREVLIQTSSKEFIIEPVKHVYIYKADGPFGDGVEHGGVRSMATPGGK